MVTDDRRLRWLTGCASALLVVLGIVLWLIVGTPWPLIVGASAVAVLALSQFASGTYAIAASVVLLVLTAVLVGRVAPIFDAGIDQVALVLLSVLGFAAAATFLLPARHRTNRPGFGRAIAAAVVPGIAVLALLVAEQLGSRGVLWAMRGDTVWNVVTARYVIEDGGHRPELHPNSSPAAAALLAMIAAVGRTDVVASDLLRHDIDRLAQLWIALALLTSLLAALVAVHTARLTRIGRWVAGIAAGLVPLSWYVMGFSWELGFLNAPVSLLLLFAAWIGWLECRISPLRGAALLSFATVGLLATWAPLAIIPAGLAAAALIADRRRIRQSLGAVAAWVLIALPVPLYAIAVTVEDLRRDGPALSVDGGFPDLDASDALVTVGVTLSLICLVGVRAGDRHRLAGVAAVVVSALIGVAYLVVQRIPTGQPWGYYPAKMTWLVLVLLIVLAIGSLCAVIPAGQPVRPGAIALAAAGAVALAGCAILVPPVRQPVAQNLLPWVDVMRGTGVASPAAAPEALFALAEPGVKTMAVGLGDHDAFVNFWLLQLESDSGDDPIRVYAYALDPRDTAQVCDAITVWGGDVVVHTSDPQLEGRLDEVCADADWSVELHG